MSCWPGKRSKNKIEDKSHSNSSSIILVDETEDSSRNSSLKKQQAGPIEKWAESHPFEALMVLEKIFSNLSVNELLVVRQVDKRWNSAACYVLRRKIEGAVILQRGLAYYTKVMGNWDSLGNPVGRLFLKIDNMEDTAVTRFFQVIGPSTLFLILNLEGNSFANFLGQIHHLDNLVQLSLNLFQEEFSQEDIKIARRRKATSIRIFIDDYDNQNLAGGGPILPNLESFVLSCEPDWKSNEAILLERLLTMCPNLKNLNLNKWPFILRPDLFSRGSFEELKFLAVKSLDDRAFATLGTKRLLNLKTIECTTSHDVRQESFQAFMETVAGSLEYVEMENTMCPELVFRVPSTMKKLKTIRVPHWTGPVCLDSIIAYCPRLEKLQLSHVNPELLYLKELRPLASVTYLALNFGSGSHAMKKIIKTVKNFVSVVPNLKVFMMKRVSDKIMEIICEGWPQLEALRITTSFALTDSGITGIPMSELQKLAKLDARLSCDCCVPVPVADGEARLDTVRVLPHISMLRALKDLRIEAEQGTNFTLTNYSLHLGIHELRTLVSLKLTCHELGPHWCLKCIGNHLPNLKMLTVMDRAISHDRFDEQEIHYLLRKIPNLQLTFADAGL